MTNKIEKFVVVQKAILIREGKCLIFERGDKLGYWDIPGGRVDIGEDSETALRREIKDELGLDDFEILGTLDHDIWYWEDKDPFCAIAILIRSEHNEIRTSAKHGMKEWISEDEIDNYNFYWPEVMPRMIRKGFAAYKQMNK